MSTDVRGPSQCEMWARAPSQCEMWARAPSQCEMWARAPSQRGLAIPKVHVTSQLISHSFIDNINHNYYHNVEITVILRVITVSMSLAILRRQNKGLFILKN